MSTTMTIRLEAEMKRRLDVLASATRRSKSRVVAEAIRQYVELNEWQIDETRSALGQADASEYASDDDVAALAEKWKPDAPLRQPGEEAKPTSVDALRRRESW